MEVNVDFSDASSDMSGYASEDADEFEDTAAEELKEGNISVYNRNGELSCPFCSGKEDPIQICIPLPTCNRANVELKLRESIELF